MRDTAACQADRLRVMFSFPAILYSLTMLLLYTCYRLCKRCEAHTATCQADRLRVMFSFPAILYSLTILLLPSVSDVRDYMLYNYHFGNKVIIVK